MKTTLDTATANEAKAQKAVTDAAAGKQQAEETLTQADVAKQKAQAALQTAKQRFDGLALYLSPAARATAFEDGVDDWTRRNEPELAQKVDDARDAYRKAMDDKAAADDAYAKAKEAVAAKQAAYDRAQADYTKAGIATLAAQQEYDALVANEKAEAESNAKVSQAKHATAEDKQAALAQTGDALFEYGIVQLAGLAMMAGSGAALARRKMKGNE